MKKGENTLRLNISRFKDIDRLKDIILTLSTDNYSFNKKLGFEFNNPINFIDEKIYINQKREFNSLDNRIIAEKGDNVIIEFIVEKLYNLEYYDGEIILDLDDFDLGDVSSDSFDVDDSDDVKTSVKFDIPFNVKAKRYEIPYTIKILDEFDNEFIIEKEFDFEVNEKDHSIRISELFIGSNSCEDFFNADFKIINDGVSEEDISITIKSTDLDFTYSQKVTIDSGESFDFSKLLFISKSKLETSKKQPVFLVELLTKDEKYFEAHTADNLCYKESITNTKDQKIASLESKNDKSEDEDSKQTNFIYQNYIGESELSPELKVLILMGILNSVLLISSMFLIVNIRRPRKPKGIIK